MDEFLKQNYSLMTHSVEFLAAAAGLYHYKKYQATAAKYFIFYLIAIFAFELLGSYPLYIDKIVFLSFLNGTVFKSNYWWTTLFWSIGSVMFFCFFYNKILTNALHKTISFFIAILFFLFSIAYILLNFNDFFHRFFPILIVLGAIVIFLNVCFHYMEMLQSERILFFYKNINFYISSALLVWWLITTPLMFYDVYFSTSDWNFVFLKWQIFLFANIFMYLTFTFAFLFCDPEHD